MPTKIKPDYKPSQRVFELLKAFGVQNPVEFVGHEMGAFFLYWEGTGKTKASWDTTCLNWMKRTYEDKKHQMAQNRSYSGQQGNVFETVLDNIQNHEPPKPKMRVVYRNPEPPPDLGTMDTEEALEALAQLRRKL